jgi:hypothetical protein
MPSGLHAVHPACRVDGEFETVAHCSAVLCTPSASAMAKSGSVSKQALLSHERREGNVPQLLS